MRTYTNPIYQANFPDPFVLRHRGRYYAYATGPAGDGRMFPMLTSRDLVEWTACGGALEPLDLPGAEEYWAPEVAYSEGRFYFYYATGRRDDPDHHLRVAVSEHPLGPWQDRGLNLTPHEIFAIDAHPFRDPRDGQWYLYYAQDRLAGPYAGTGVVVDRLVTMEELARDPQPVARPCADWQVFELQRAVKQGLDWYTVEGPFTLCVDGRYLCFYSGGRWENPNYGVGYALAPHPLGPWVDEANREGPQVLTTVPDRVIGPGHNSVVLGPDLVSSWLVYHGWDPGCTARYPRIDRLEWIEGRPYCNGPSWEPRPAPAMPDVIDWFDEADPGAAWASRGTLRRDGEGLWLDGAAPLTLARPVQGFVAETAFRAEDPSATLVLNVGEVAIAAGGGKLRLASDSVPLPPGHRPDAWHHLRIRREGERLTVTIDEFPTLTAPAPAGAARLTLEGAPGLILSHFALTHLPDVI